MLTVAGTATRLRLIDRGEGGLSLAGSFAGHPGQRGTIALPGERPREVEIRSVQGDRIGLAYAQPARAAA